MELQIPDRQFVCVDYPCVINDVSKVLSTLGGEKAVTRTYLDPSRRLELRLRPQDVYCKPACADRKEFTGLLLRIRRKRHSSTKNQPNTQGEGEPVKLEGITQPSSEDNTNADQIEGEILGIVDTIYNFSSMADYQYLPMVKAKDGVYQSLLDQLVIDRFLPRTWLKEPARLHMPPPIFTRFGRPILYCYRETQNPGKGHAMATNPSSNIIGIARERRPRFTAFFRFAHETVPKAPYTQAVAKLAQHKVHAQSIEEVKEMFELRPIWTRSALRGHLPHMTRDELQYILPTVSFYCQDGPWRTMWVRFGYDMRKDPASKIYQNLDFRLRRTTPGVTTVVPAKRSTYEYYLPNTVTKVYSQTSVIQKESFQALNPDDLNILSHQKAARQAMSATYKFSPGIVPPFRQMFYHLCDVEEPEVQRLVHVNDGQETECTEKDGWCLPETVDKCRAILLGHLQKIFASMALNFNKTAAGEIAVAHTSSQSGAIECLNSEAERVALDEDANYSSSSSESEEYAEDEDDAGDEDAEEEEDDRGDEDV